MALQFGNVNEVIVVAGRSGSGKSTVANIFLLNEPLTCRFIFDPEGEFAERLGHRACQTLDELAAAIATGWVIFNPTFLFPGSDVAQTETSQRAFESFCGWVWRNAVNIPGRKILLADEIWKFCKPNFIPVCLRAIVQNGRKRGIGLLATTQTPNFMHETIIREATEFIGFRLEGRNLLKFLEDNMNNFPVSELPTLLFEERRRARCIAQNRLSGVAWRYELNHQTGKLSRLR
jgi:hypothetical protein